MPDNFRRLRKSERRVKQAMEPKITENNPTISESEKMVLAGQVVIGNIG